MTVFSEFVIFQAGFQSNGPKPDYARADLTTEANAVHTIPMHNLRVWDTFDAVLPGTPAADDLGLIGGTFGTGAPSVQTGDLKGAGATTRRARFLYQLPHEYVAGATAILRLHAGMLTTVSDNSATIDAEAFKSDEGGGVSGSDMVSTSAQSINSLTLANKDFVLTAASLLPGDMLDVRISIAVNDAATGTAVIGILGAIKLLLGVKG